MTALAADEASIQEYLKQVSAGLVGIGEAEKREILAEIACHLRDRTTELTAQGSLHPIEHAISGLGDPARLASDFVAEMRTKRGIGSYSPWSLLRSAARIARTGGKGFLVFLIGLIGYGLTLGGLVAAILKPFFPEMGLWVGSWGVVWGVKSDAVTGHELLGPYFIQASIGLSFVFATVTTLLLRRLINRISFFGKWPAEFSGARPNEPSSPGRVLGH